MHAHLNILAPIDLARNAEAQVGYAIEVARSFTSDLTLLYVADPLRSPPTSRPIEWLPSAMTERVDCRIRRVALRGPVVETVTEYADDAGADLVVLTSRHYGRWARLWTDSVAADIVASTLRPVLVTKAKATGPVPHMPFRRVLSIVSLDGTDESVVRYADSITARLRGKLNLLHVMPEVPEALFMGPAEIEWRRVAEQSAASRLQELSDSICSPHSTAMLGGSAYTSIKQAVREYGADLVVTGRPPPESGWGATLDLRTLLNRLRCPLLSVPTGLSEAGSLGKGVIEPCLASH